MTDMKETIKEDISIIEHTQPEILLAECYISIRNALFFILGAGIFSMVLIYALQDVELTFFLAVVSFNLLVLVLLIILQAKPGASSELLNALTSMAVFSVAGSLVILQGDLSHVPFVFILIFSVILCLTGMLSGPLWLLITYGLLPAFIVLAFIFIPDIFFAYAVDWVRLVLLLVWCIAIYFLGTYFNKMMVDMVLHARQLTEELDTLDKEVKSLDIEKEKEKQIQYIITVASKLRKLIASILTSAKEGKDNATKEDYDRNELGGAFDSIKGTADLLLRLVNNILDVKKFDNNQIGLQLQETDIKEVVLREVKKNEPRFAEKNVKLQVSETVTFGKMVLDEQRIQQMCGELLSNALDASQPEQTVNVNFSKTMMKNKQGLEESAISISIVNEGAGINENIKSFEKSYPMNLPESERYGIMLGLSVCKSIVTLHQGTIFAKNNSNGFGFTYTFILPFDLTLPEEPKEVEQKVETAEEGSEESDTSE